MKHEGHHSPLQLRMRCFLRSRGLHQLDIATGRCSYCKRDWATLQAREDSWRPPVHRALKAAGTFCAFIVRKAVRPRDG